MATLSSIITPTNIATTNSVQTLTNKTITGGILNGTLGATTPSTVAATTITATGTITSTGQGLILSHANPRIDFIGSAASQTWYLGDGVGGTNGNFILRDGTNSTNAITVAQGTRAMTLNGAVSVTGTISATSTISDAIGDVRIIPQNSQSAAYTLVLADAGKHILHPAADTTARVFTIPANGSVAYTIGTAITFINQNAAGVITIAITTDTMRLAGAGTTGSRTLAANGVATAVKITATEWIISGTGLT